jgi:hypothetical protein
MVDLYPFENLNACTVFRLLTDFVCLYNYEFGLSLCKIVRSSVILLLPLFTTELGQKTAWCESLRALLP